MERKFFATTVLCLITLLVMTHGANAEEWKKIAGPWLWMIASTFPGEGGADSIHIDSLAAECADKHGSQVTEDMIAKIGANEGDQVGKYQWTSGKIDVDPPGTWDVLFGDGNINKIIGKLYDKGDLDDYTSYALITVESDIYQSGKIGISSDDAFKVWLNGLVVGSKAMNRGADSENFQDEFNIKLKQGPNLLMVKVSERDQQWAMYVGLKVVDKDSVDFSILRSADINDNGILDDEDAEIVAEILDHKENNEDAEIVAEEILDDEESPGDYADINGDGKVSLEDLDLVKGARENTTHIPVVRLYYVYKEGEPPNDKTKEDFVSGAEEAQEFYRTEMERNGFGRKTFELDTKVRLKEWDAEKELAPDQDKMKKAFDSYIHDEDGSWDIHLFFLDNILSGNKYPAAAAFEHRIAYITTEKDENYRVPTIAHELGHTFGFIIHSKPETNHIDTDDKYPIMSISCPELDKNETCEISYPISKQFLPRDSAFWLSKHPLFNRFAPVINKEETELSFKNLEAFDKHAAVISHRFKGDDMSGIKFKVEDPDGIHMVAVTLVGVVENKSKIGVSELFFSDPDGDGIVTVCVPITKDFLDSGERQFMIAVMDGAGNIKIFGYPKRWKAPELNTPASPSLVSFLPAETSLLPNYPNPFNPETWLPYQLSKSADVALTIYDIQGRVVRALDLGHQRAGMYHSRSRAAYWDGRNAVGEPVASGLYFYTLKAGDFAATRKMLIRK